MCAGMCKIELATTKYLAFSTTAKSANNVYRPMLTSSHAMPTTATMNTTAGKCDHLSTAEISPDLK